MKKEKKMIETKTEEKQAPQLEGRVSLAFRVKAHGDNLFSPEMLLIVGDKIVEARNGTGTTLGHAIAAADDLMDGWAFNEIETKAEDYFKTVIL